MFFNRDNNKKINKLKNENRILEEKLSKLIDEHYKLTHGYNRMVRENNNLQKIVNEYKSNESIQDKLARKQLEIIKEKERKAKRNNCVDVMYF